MDVTKRAMDRHDVNRIVVPVDPDLDPDGIRVAYTLATPSTEDDRTHSWIMCADLAGGDPRRLTQGSGDSSARWSPDGGALAFVRAVDDKAQVHLLPMSGGEPRAVTSIPEGVASYRWAPDGQRLLVTSRMDDRGPATDPEESKRRRAEPIDIIGLGYKADGIGFARRLVSQVLVVDVATGQATRLTEGSEAASSPVLSPDGGRIAFLRNDGPEASRPWGNSLWIMDPDGANARRLTDLGGNVASVDWSPDGTALIVAGNVPTSSDEIQRLYLVDPSHGRVQPLAHDLDRNVMLGAGPGYPGAAPRFTPDGGAVLATVREGGCVHLLRIAIADGAVTQLVSGDDQTVSGLADRGDVLVVSMTSATAPTELFVVDPGSGTTRQLTHHNRELLDEVEVVPAVRREFTAPDGTRIEGWTYGAEPGTPKPTLLEIHGGPHNAWGPSLAGTHRQELVERGWVVLTINSRGSDGYGAEFFRALHAGWGRNDEDDFLSAVDQLVADGIADPERLAVSGYSYGGYMTNWLVTRTDRFRAAVSGAGICDLVSFAGAADLGAAFLRSEFGVELHDKPELYRELSPLTYVTNVTTPMLIVHGMADTRCPLGQAEQWFTSLRRRGVDVEMALIPDEHHGMGAARLANRVEFYGRMIDWLVSRVESG